ncbi:MAG: class I SAM-dependent DNA methyltransferase [Candidatus Heimdallarchaeota archaeon]
MKPFNGSKNSQTPPMPKIIEDITSELVSYVETKHFNQTADFKRHIQQDLGRIFNRWKPEEFSTFSQSVIAHLLIAQILYYLILNERSPQLGLKPLNQIESIFDLKALFDRIFEVNGLELFSIPTVSTLKNHQITLDRVILIIKVLDRYKTYVAEHDFLGFSLQRSFPPSYRKILAAYHTSIPASRFLANLAIEEASDTIFDPACGSGGLLVASYQRRKQIDPTFPEQSILRNTFGSDISPLACLFASMNLSLQAALNMTYRADIVCTDAFEIDGNRTLGSYFNPTDKGSYQGERPNKFNVLLGNPPFTQGDRLDSQYKEHLCAWFEKRGFSANKFIDKKHLGLHGYFLLAASHFLKPGGTVAFVLPFSIFYTESTSPIVRYLLQTVNIEYLIKSDVEPAFSDSSFEEIILIARKNYDGPIKIIILQESLTAKSLDEIDDLANTIKYTVSDGDFQDFRLLSVSKREFYVNRWTVFFRSYDFVRLWRTIKTKTSPVTDRAEIIRGNRVAPVRLYSLPNKIWEIVSITPTHINIQTRKGGQRRFRFPQTDIVRSMKRYNEMAEYPNLIPEGAPQTYYIRVNQSSIIFGDWLKSNGLNPRVHSISLYPPIERETHLAIPQKIGWSTTKTIAFYSHKPLHVGDGFMSINMDPQESFWYFCYLTSSFGIFNILAVWRPISGNYGQILGPDMEFFRHVDFSNVPLAKKKNLRELVQLVSQNPVKKRPTFLKILKSIQKDPINPLYQIDLIIAETLGLDSKFVDGLHSVLITELSRYK